MKVCGFAAGCYWGVEHAFKMLDGVVDTTVGFQGGEQAEPTYIEVCEGKSGHAESVRVTYDESIISLERLLDAFFFMHDPTQSNRQGPDIGTQYRSALFPEDTEQEEAINIYLEKVRANYLQEVVTTIEIDKAFFSAENMHQDYLVSNPGGYCHIGPEIFSKLKQGLF